MKPTPEQLLEHAKQVSDLTKHIRNLTNYTASEFKRQHRVEFTSSLLDSSEISGIFELGRQAKIASLTAELESLLNVISIQDTSSSVETVGQDLVQFSSPPPQECPSCPQRQWE